MSEDLRTQISAIAIEISEQDFDNMHPMGISSVDWLNNFYCPTQDLGSDFQITETNVLRNRFMLDLYDLIRNIQKRPAMYLGQPSIHHLKTFLAGYFFARHQLGQPESLQEQHFTDFQPWIQQRFKIESSQSWDKIILFFPRMNKKR